METKSFASRDEQEVAGYADAMDMIFDGYDAITLTENHIKQLHSFSFKSRSSPSSAQLESAGEIIPPCGVPSVVS